MKNGPHTLSAGELETLCWLTAQRLSLLHELNAPEFFDRSLFRGFIQKLRERRVISADENGKLDFDAELEHGREGCARDPEPRDPPRHPEADAGKTGGADAQRRTSRSKLPCAIAHDAPLPLAREGCVSAGDAFTTSYRLPAAHGCPAAACRRMLDA